MLPVLPYKLQLTESVINFWVNISFPQSKQDLKYIYIKSDETPKLDLLPEEDKLFSVCLEQFFFFGLETVWLITYRYQAVSVARYEENGSFQVRKYCLVKI